MAKREIKTIEQWERENKAIKIKHDSAGGYFVIIENAKTGKLLDARGIYEDYNEAKTAAIEAGGK